MTNEEKHDVKDMIIESVLKAVKKGFYPDGSPKVDDGVQACTIAQEVMVKWGYPIDCNEPR
jgi:hypothetical protein